MKRLQKCALALALASTAVSPAAADELTYHLAARTEDPPEKVAIFKGEIDDVRLIKEPVARVSSASVEEARLERHAVEPIDEENPITEVFQVTLVLEDKKQDEIAKTMEGVCKNRRGVYAVWVDKAADWRPFLFCDRFDVAVVFLDGKRAEDFARKLSPKKVTRVTPTSD